MLMSRLARTVRAAATCLTISIAAAACRPQVQPTPSSSDDVPLVIMNHDYFDVSVYVQPADGVQGFRVATVNGFGTRTVRVRRALLERGTEITLQVHALGTSYSWTSQTITIDSHDVARLDVYSDANGDLHRCSLYARAM